MLRHQKNFGILTLICRKNHWTREMLDDFIKSQEILQFLSLSDVWMIIHHSFVPFSNWCSYADLFWLHPLPHLFLLHAVHSPPSCCVSAGGPDRLNPILVDPNRTLALLLLLLTPHVLNVSLRVFSVVVAWSDVATGLYKETRSRSAFFSLRKRTLVLLVPIRPLEGRSFRCVCEGAVTRRSTGVTNNITR